MVSKSGLVVIRKLLPLMLTAALSVSPVPATKVYVKVSPTLTSVLDKVPMVELADTFSARDVALKMISDGAVFGTKGMAETEELEVPGPALFTARI